MPPFTLRSTCNIHRDTKMMPAQKFDVVEVLTEEACNFQMIMAIVTLEKTVMTGRYECRKAKVKKTVLDTFLITADMDSVVKSARSPLRFVPYPMYELKKSRRGRGYNYVPELRLGIIQVPNINRPACFVPAFHEQILPTSDVTKLQYYGFSYMYCDRSNWNKEEDVFSSAVSTNEEDSLRFLLNEREANLLEQRQISRFDGHASDDEGDDYEQQELVETFTDLDTTV
jgi:hypothetical protein